MRKKGKPPMNANEHESGGGITASDKYDNIGFDLVPRGPFKGQPWEAVPALTLHNLLNAVDFGLIQIDERRVVAIREGLRKKDEGGSLKAQKNQPQMDADERGVEGGMQG